MKNVFLETGNVVAFREALGVLEDTEKGQPGLGAHPDVRRLSSFTRFGARARRLWMPAAFRLDASSGFSGARTLRSM